jgi:holo-[acyl-carrier protein] synthase
MNIIGHGIDLVDCDRIREAIEKHGRHFLDRVFTPAEQEYCLGRKREIEHLAGRFAAKEAVLKVLGTGWQNGIAWTDIEVVNRSSGQPIVNLQGRCREIADEQGIQSLLVSISHVESHAMASAIAQKESAGGALGIGD